MNKLPLYVNKITNDLRCTYIQLLICEVTLKDSVNEEI